LTRYLTAAEIKAINSRILGSLQLRDTNALESAVARPKHSAFGADAYRDLFNKAGALMESLIQNHPFVDGNKRTGFVAVAMFLALNGYWLEVKQGEVVEFALNVASSKYTVSQIASWLRNHSKEI
jgi:death-on-curing protein